MNNSTTEISLIERLLQELSKITQSPIPFEVALWDIKRVAEYFGVTVKSASRSIICQPAFPKAVRVEKDSHPRYFASEVIEFAKSRKERN